MQTKNKDAEMYPQDSDRYYRVLADFSYLEQYHYKIVKQIGRGGYGVVYKAIDKANQNKSVAIKINFSTICREIVFCQIAYLELFQGKKRLPKLKNLILVQNNPHIVMEYFPYKAFITFFNTFEMIEIKHYLIEFLLGAKELKELGIYHRDLKPGNFLYNCQNRRGVIIDFGLAEIDPAIFKQLQSKIIKLKKHSHIPQKKQQLVEIQKKFKKYNRLASTLNKVGRNKIGTQSFMPIQSILHHRQQTYSSDIWAIGVVFLQLLLRKYNVFNPLTITNMPQDLKSTFFVNYLIQLSIFFGRQAVTRQCERFGYQLKLPMDAYRCQFRDIVAVQGYDKTVENLLLGMLKLNPEERITVEQAINHKFFDEVRTEHLKMK